MLLQVRAMFEAAKTRFKHVNTFVHYSKKMGKINPDVPIIRRLVKSVCTVCYVLCCVPVVCSQQVLEWIQDNLNEHMGSTSCKMTHKWITGQVTHVPHVQRTTLWKQHRGGPLWCATRLWGRWAMWFRMLHISPNSCQNDS